MDISDAFTADSIGLTADEETELETWLGEVIGDHLDSNGVTNSDARNAMTLIMVELGKLAFIAGRNYEDQFNNFNSTTFPVELDTEVLQEFLKFLIQRRGL